MRFSEKAKPLFLIGFHKKRDYIEGTCKIKRTFVSLIEIEEDTILEKRIRMATLEDCERILEIYTPYILKSTASFEYEVPSVEEFRDRMKGIQAQFPWLVCEIDGKIAGYAYASKHAQRAAYQWSADVSIYLDESYHRMHIATDLYDTLIDIIRKQGYYTAYALISVPNERSDAFHERFGFKHVGTIHKAGYKHGEWHDLKYYEYELADYTNEPAPTISVHDLELNFA